MSSSMWGYLFLVLGIMSAALLILFGNINTKREQNYYLLKEVTQNAMLDSVDQDAYNNGISEDVKTEINNYANEEIFACKANVPVVRIVTEKFVENFTRRYAELANEKYDYIIEIFDIQECPPKVSLRVSSTEDYSWVESLFRGGNTNGEITIVNDLSAILETKD